MEGGYTADTPQQSATKQHGPEEKRFLCTVGTLAETAEREKIMSTALIIVGNIIGEQYDRSLLYDPSFTTAFRDASE